MTNLQTTGYQRRPGGVITGAETRPTETAVATLPANHIVVEGFRGIRIMVIGDTNDETAGLEIWSYERSSSFNRDKAQEIYIPRLFLEIATVTIGDGTAKGIAGSELVTDTEFFAQTYTAVVFTKAYGQKVLANFNGSADVYSPAANDIGELFISDFGNAYALYPILDAANGNFYRILYKLDV